MASITDLSDIINRATTSGSNEHLFFYKDARSGSSAAAATVAGRLTSLWTYNGQPGGGIPPVGGTPVILNRENSGSLFQNNNSGSSQKWLLGMTAGALNAGTLFLYDRLLHQGGLAATNIRSQSVGGTITRNTSGSGNQIFIEIYDQIGVTGTVISASYTNQDGVSGRLTQATTFGGTGFREAQRLIQLPLQSGDTGVRSVEHIKFTASTTTTGSFGVTLANPIVVISLGVVGVGGVRDLIAGLPGPIEIESGSCLALYWLANTTTAPQVFGSLHFIDK